MIDLFIEWISHNYGTISVGKAFVIDNLAKSMSVKEGDIIYVKINATSFFENLWVLLIIFIFVSYLIKELTMSQYFIGNEIDLDDMYVPIQLEKIFDGPQGY